MSLDQEQKHSQKQKWKKKEKVFSFVDKQQTCISVECRQHRVKNIQNNRRNVEKQLFREQWFSKLRKILNR
jgi:hypothetical protein